MKSRLFTSTAVIALLVGVAFQARTTAQSRETTIKVVINQAPPDDGVAPIEIIQPACVSSAPNKLDNLTYFLRNNSDKAVIAAVVVRTMIFEEGGKTYADSVYSMMDSVFHPDMPGKPLLPASRMSMGTAGPISFSEGVVIKEITLTLEYGLFDDNSAYGPGSEGERKIAAIREGTRRYKSWLVEEYARAGKSLTSIFPLIQAPGIPEALKLDSNQTIGADRYRLQLVSTLRKKGAADVESYLKQNQ